MPLPGGYDAVLVDPPAPASVLSARPDARWRRREESLEPWPTCSGHCSAGARARARPGERVVYSTCTLIAEESEDVVAAAGAALDDLGAEYPGLAHPRRPEALLHAPAPPRHRRVLHRQDAPAVSAQAPPASRSMPSLMSADPLRVGEQLDALIGAGARAFHVDVMDAHFVPNLTLGPDFARAVAAPIHAASGLVDVHLMVARPGEVIRFFADAADAIAIHVEADPHPHRLLAVIRAAGCWPASRSTPGPPSSTSPSSATISTT